MKSNPSIFSSAGNTPVVEPVACSRASLIFFRHQALQRIAEAGPLLPKDTFLVLSSPFLNQHKPKIAALVIQGLKCFR